ncbi:MAG TPA: Mut7-C RNAse domain-containing protein [Vicinamibacteria bacterium]|nr:Mut7-C RNAse domain-containing protein [Vicinamibacteria bacterium]
MVEAETPRFVADVMVGRLARWLRVLGVDVLFDPCLDDRGLLAIARRDQRVVLTRDVPLASATGEPQRLLIESDDFREQLLQVVGTYHLDPFKRLFSRCIDCNSPLQPALREEARHRVPPYVFSTQAGFQRCPGCDKILWGGTHRDHMHRLLRRLFAPQNHHVTTSR